MAPVDEQIAFPILTVCTLGWHDLEAGFDGRQAFEVLKPLFEVAQVEHVAR